MNMTLDDIAQYIRIEQDEAIADLRQSHERGQFTKSSRVSKKIVWNGT